MTHAQRMADIRAALARVADPELSLSIVDVGLVYGVVLHDQEVEVLLTMTSAACPVTAVILADVHQELELVLPPTVAIRLELVWDPPWDPAMLSARARSFLED